MPRKKKPPTIDEQLQNLVAQAVDEKRYELSKSLIAILWSLAPAPEEKKEE